MAIELSVCIEKVFDDDPFLDRIDRAARAGADAVEFWGWRDKDLDAIVARCETHGLALAGMVAGAGSLVDPAGTADAVEALEESIDRAAEVGCPTLIVTVGLAEPDLSRETQRAAIVDALEGAAPTAEAAAVTLAIEPLNVAVDHAGYFLAESAEAFDIVEAVDSARVTVLFDVYHQQITEGDVTRRLTENVDRIGHVHIADNPGRNEPGTGELNYTTVLPALDEAGYTGYVGCEYDPIGDPESTVSDVVAMLPGGDP